MVGQTPEDVETGAADDSLSGDSASPAFFEERPIKQEIKQESDVNDVDMVYGTYDEATNCITIIYPGEESAMGIQECVQEVVSTEGTCHEDANHSRTPNGYLDFSPAYTCTDTMSPSSVHSDEMESSPATIPNKLEIQATDVGYESYDSTGEDGNIGALGRDLWHESFSELFPSLA